MRQRGVTLVEVVIAATIFVILLGAAAVAVARDHETYRALTTQVGREIPARHALERIATELRMAGEWAEDKDHDGELDDGEDSNENGVLDSAWDLPDGASNQDHLHFNRRIDLRDEAGALLASGVYTRAVGYRLEGSNLIRESEHGQAGGSVVLRESVIARGISGLRFSRAGVLVTVELDVIVPERTYAPGRRTLATRVWLRN